jgi:hypothetical protein
MVYHCAIGNETNKSVLGKQTQTHHKRFFQRGEAVSLLAHIDDIEEDRGRRRRSGEAIFYCGIRRMKFGGDSVCSNVLVVRWKLISRKAERADPNSGTNIDLTSVPGQQMKLEQPFRRASYQNGFNTERQGCLHVTGSKWRRGVSGFSFNGV